MGWLTPRVFAMPSVMHTWRPFFVDEEQDFDRFVRVGWLSPAQKARRLRDLGECAWTLLTDNAGTKVRV